MRVRIDPKTGLLARDEQENAIEEVFLEGTQPTETAPEEKTDEDAAAEEGADGETPGEGAGDGPDGAGRDGEVKTPPAAKVVGTEEEAAAELPPF